MTTITRSGHVPLPLRPVGRPGDDILSRLERKAAWRSPIVLHNPAPFTRAQQTAKPPKAPRPPRVKSAPKPVAPQSFTLDQLRACSAEGLTRRETADRLKVDKQTVRLWAARVGITFTDGRKRPSSAAVVDVDELRRLAQQGLSMPQIAREMGLTEGETYSRLRQHRIRTRDPRSIKPAERDEILRLHSVGVTIPTIARLVNRADPTVRRCIERASQ